MIYFMPVNTTFYYINDNTLQFSHIYFNASKTCNDMIYVFIKNIYVVVSCNPFVLFYRN
jgi:hypothetical protein